MSQHYFYKAMDNAGHIVQGQLEANNISDLEARLERMGLDLINSRSKRSRTLRLGRVSRQELITFCFHMEQLTQAGVPLLDGLSDLRDSLPQSRFREIISSLCENIQGGEYLSESMAHFSDTFDNVFVALIRAGEQSGNLAKVFKHLTETLKWSDEMITKTKKLMLYPIFVSVVIIGVLFFLMIYLVPQLLSFLKNIDAELPIHTQALLFVSDIFVSYWYIILALPFAAFALLKMLMQVSPSTVFLIDHIKLRIWVIGPIIEKIILARFATFFGLLYGSGITVLDSLNICKSLAGNVVIQQALEEVNQQIADGGGISQSFAKVRLFPPLVLRMIKVGENTGELDTALLNVSYFYNREVKDSIEKLQTLIEPSMTIVLGILLGWVVLSVLGPIYDNIAKVSGGVERRNQTMSTIRNSGGQQKSDRGVFGGGGNK